MFDHYEPLLTDNWSLNFKGLTKGDFLSSNRFKLNILRAPNVHYYREGQRCCLDGEIVDLNAPCTMDFSWRNKIIFLKNTTSDRLLDRSL